MKKLTTKWWFWVGIIVGCVLLSYAMEARGEGINLEVAPMMVMPTSGDNQSAELGYGVEASITTDLGDGFRVGLGGSWEERFLRLYGQRAGTLTIYGVGPIILADLTKNISIYGKIGYYFTDYSMRGRGHIAEGYEGMYLYWGSWIKNTGFPISLYQFESFERKINGGFGGEIGLDLHHNIGKHWMVGLGLGYRFLELEEHRKAYLPHCWCGLSDPYIETKESHDYGGFKVKLRIEYTFKSIFGI